jgi:hypothetical protein
VIEQGCKLNPIVIYMTCAECEGLGVLIEICVFTLVKFDMFRLNERLSETDLLLGRGVRRRLRVKEACAPWCAGRGAGDAARSSFRRPRQADAGQRAGGCRTRGGPVVSSQRGRRHRHAPAPL